MKRRKSVLAYEPDIYTPQGVRQNLTTAQARKEYKRLRSIAMRRLKAFEGTEFTDTQIYKQNAGKYPAQSKLKDRELIGKLISLASFLEQRESTLTANMEIRAKALSTLNRHGYKIKAEEWISFGEYMEKARASSIAKFFDSERAAELFEEMFDRPESLEDILQEYKNYEREEIKQRARLRRGKKRV